MPEPRPSRPVPARHVLADRVELGELGSTPGAGVGGVYYPRSAVPDPPCIHEPVSYR